MTSNSPTVRNIGPTPTGQVPAVVEALLNALKDPDSSVKSSAAKALVVVESYGKKAQSVFFDLDPLRGYTGKLR